MWKIIKYTGLLIMAVVMIVLMVIYSGGIRQGLRVENMILEKTALSINGSNYFEAESRETNDLYNGVGNVQTNN
jgi:hypothetical protein